MNTSYITAEVVKFNDNDHTFVKIYDNWFVRDWHNGLVPLYAYGVPDNYTENYEKELEHKLCESFGYESLIASETMHEIYCKYSSFLYVDDLYRIARKMEMVCEEDDDIILPECIESQVRQALASMKNTEKISFDEFVIDFKRFFVCAKENPDELLREYEAYGYIRDDLGYYLDEVL